MKRLQRLAKRSTTATNPRPRSGALSGRMSSYQSILMTRWQALSARDQLALLLLSAFLLLFVGGYGGYSVHQAANASKSEYQEQVADYFWLRAQAGNIDSNALNAASSADGVDAMPPASSINALLNNSGIADAQAQNIANALLNQRPVMMDAADSVETASPDLTATEKSIAFISSKLAFYLGLPSSYITGEQTGGIGSTGEADMRAVERGLKGYYYSILKPVLEAIFGVSVEYKSQDSRNIQSGIEVLKVFAMTDEELLSRENKTMILNKIFDLPEDSEGDGPAPQPQVVQAPSA